MCSFVTNNLFFKEEKMTFFWESDKAEKAEAESQICNFPGKR